MTTVFIKILTAMILLLSPGFNGRGEGGRDSGTKISDQLLFSKSVKKLENIFRTMCSHLHYFHLRKQDVAT